MEYGSEDFSCGREQSRNAPLSARSKTPGSSKLPVARAQLNFDHDKVGHTQVGSGLLGDAQAEADSLGR